MMPIKIYNGDDDEKLLKASKISITRQKKKKNEKHSQCHQISNAVCNPVDDYCKLSIFLPFSGLI